MQQTVEATIRTEPVFNQIRLEEAQPSERLQLIRGKEHHLHQQEEVQVRYIDNHQEAVLVPETHIEGLLLHRQEAPPTHQVEALVQDLVGRYPDPQEAVAEAAVEVPDHQVVVAEEDVNSKI